MHMSYLIKDTTKEGKTVFRHSAEIAIQVFKGGDSPVAQTVSFLAGVV